MSGLLSQDEVRVLCAFCLRQATHYVVVKAVEGKLRATCSEHISLEPISLERIK